MMELTTRQDIDAPIDWVWSKLADLEAFETLAMRRGAEVTRVTDNGFAPGTAWEARFRFRGRDRDLKAALTEVTAPESWGADISIGGLEGVVSVSLSSLPRDKTRLIITATLSARTLSARLLLQSAKLAKGGVNARFRNRVAGFAEDLGKEYKRAS